MGRGSGKNCLNETKTDLSCQQKANSILMTYEKYRDYLFCRWPRFFCKFKFLIKSLSKYNFPMSSTTSKKEYDRIHLSVCEKEMAECREYIIKSIKRIEFAIKSDEEKKEDEEEKKKNEGKKKKKKDKFKNKTLLELSIELASLSENVSGMLTASQSLNTQATDCLNKILDQADKSTPEIPGKRIPAPERDCLQAAISAVCTIKLLKTASGMWGPDWQDICTNAKKKK